MAEHEGLRLHVERAEERNLRCGQNYGFSLQNPQFHGGPNIMLPGEPNDKQREIIEKIKTLNTRDYEARQTPLTADGREYRNISMDDLAKEALRKDLSEDQT